jgi:hypothetical protein
VRHAELDSASRNMKLTNAFIYIMSNKNLTTFYIGVTDDLERRVKEQVRIYNEVQINLFSIL